MSRIVVKNLPKTVTDDDLRNLFVEKGQLTDIQLKFKNGKFRRFAFIGFKKESEAAEAASFFNDTYLGSSKIQVEICTELGDSNKPRSWSKYSKDSSKYDDEKAIPVLKDEKKSKKDKKKKKKIVENDEFEELKKDERFAEFLEVNTKREKKSMCANDTGVLMGSQNEVNDDESEAESDNEECEIEEKPTKLSDLEYLKSKMMGKKQKEIIKSDDKLTLVLRNLSYTCKKAEIKHFLLPIKPKSVRLPPRIKGVAYATFRTESELTQALHKNKSFLKGRKIDISRLEKSKVELKVNEKETKAQWDKAAKELESEESIAESGRLFIRNLSYTLVEDELKCFFSGYGPLAEVNLPIDKLTNNNKGFGFVTFVFPEHATKAYTELDGKSLQGRIVHILPSKAKPSEDENENKSFKQLKEQKEKSESGKGHNWNSLFMGADAVANAMVKRYNTSKNEILNPENSDSVAVRLALGETQLVNETRKFLEKNGVCLEAFDDSNSSSTERSKNVILVKNLPTGVSADELNELFAKHGTLQRIVLPPYGITAIVEFLAPAHARDAFRKLAYTKFKQLPLYLEWAPTGTFKTQVKQEDVESEKEDEKSSQSESDDDDDDDEGPEEDTTLFVKNLNFETTNDDLEKHMSKCGRVHSVTISTKCDVKKSSNLLSLGFGFVQYKRHSDANKALEQLQNSTLDGHTITLKRSNRTIKSSPSTPVKKSTTNKNKSRKILVRNIPFQAHQSEIEKLFSTFGALTSVRLPKKQFANHHRGFGFVEFVSGQEAKRAFDALSSSTHLYARRLVLEWALNEEEGAEGSAPELRRKTVHQFRASAKRMKIESVLDEMRSSHEDGGAFA